MPSQPILVNTTILPDGNTIIQWLIANNGGLEIKRGFIEWTAPSSSRGRRDTTSRSNFLILDQKANNIV